MDGVLAQEDLVRGVGGIGLVLVDPGGCRIVEDAAVVGGAGHAIGAGVELIHGGPGEHHEVVGAADHETRIIGCQGDHHGAPAAFADEGQAMVKELAKDGEEGVIGCR